MKKATFDNRPLNQVINELLHERTDAGDDVHMIVNYRGADRPQLILEFGTKHDALKHYEPREEITDFLPEKPYWQKLDGDGEPVGREQGGWDNWKEFMNHPHGLVRTVRNLVNAGGKRFKFIEDEA